MDMTNIFEMLMQEIEESAFPYFYAKGEYRRKQHCVEEHMQWLEEHLDNEAKAHLEQLRKAEMYMSILEESAQIKVAIAAGIRLALPC